MEGPGVDPLFPQLSQLQQGAGNVNILERKRKTLPPLSRAVEPLVMEKGVAMGPLGSFEENERLKGMATGMGERKRKAEEDMKGGSLRGTGEGRAGE